MQGWSFDWWDVTCILGSMAVSLLLALRLPEILAGISEIEESVTPASAEEEEGDEDREDLSSKPHRCRQRRRSSQADRSGDQSKDFEKSRDEAFKLGRADNNNLYNVGEEMLSGQSTPVSRQHRVRSTSDSRSPARPRSSTGSSSPLTTGSGPSSTCSSPRHPASHRNRKTGYPRRSLSLPNGGLSYGTDVKILYRDGHFVAVVDPQAAGSSPSTAAGGATSSSSTDLGRLTAEKDEGSPSAVSSTSSSPRRASTSSNTGPSPASVLASQILRSGSAASDAVKASMRAEILALLERGITDPKRILEEACLRSLELEPNGTAADLPISPATESAIASSTSWESAEAPMFHSLPRRRGNTRPMSVDEAQLGKFHSKSQQSLVSKAEMERRRREEVEDDGESGSPQDPGWEDRMMNLAKERSMVKRNKSFNEAMGSRVNEAVGKAMKGKTLTGQEKPANSEDDSKSVGAKARGSKGPGFIQRMLQKRRSSTQEKPPLLSIGSSSLLKASREDLAGSTVSLPQFGTSGSGQQTAPPTAQTSPGKAAGRERDTSIGRKMSLRSLFKRKNSADMSCTSVLSVTMSGGGPGATEDSGSPPIATFLNDDDIGALTNSPPTPSTVVHRRLPQRADNGEPYTVPPDDSDPLSLSYPSRSRSARAGCHTSPSPGLHAVLGRSVSQEADASLEEGGDGSPRRARSSSGRGRFQEQQTTLSPVSPSSPPSLSLSSPPSSSSSSRLLGHNSWSSSDLDVESSSEDTITSRSISPAGRSNHFQPSPASTPIADCSFSSVSEGDETLVAVQDGLSPPVYRTLTSSPMGARRRLHRDLSPTEERARDSDPRTRLAPAGPTSASPPPSLCEENESESGPVMDTSREITSSNSNDSGIQNDVNVNSSAESIMAGVRLRQSKSPSPSSSASSRRSSAHGERPKSDTTVHWAELLEQVMGAVTRTGPTAASVSAASGAVRRRHDSGRLRRRPRPKSDIAGSHIPESSVVDHLSATNSLGNLNITKSNDNITGQGTPATTTTTSLTRRSGRQQQNSLASSTNIPTGSYSNISGGCSVSSLAELRAPRGHVVLTQQLSSSSVLSSSSSSSSSAAATAASRDALLPAKLAKFRRLSTPHPISLRGEKPRPATHPAASSTSHHRSNGTAIIPQDVHLNNNNNSSSSNILPINDEADPTARLGGLSSPSPFSSCSSSDLATSSSAVSSEGGGGGGGPAQSSPGRANHSRGAGRLARAHSMPDNLDKLTRKRHFFSMLGPDNQGAVNRHISMEPEEDDADSSDDSEYSYSMGGGYRREKCRSSHLMLAALDQMLEEENLTYAEALWDHVTMDPEELGFRAGDLIRVTDCQDKHWWFGVLDDTEGWFPAAFVRLRVNQDLMDTDLDFLLSAGGLSLASDASHLIDSNGNSFQSSTCLLRPGSGETTIQAQKVSGVTSGPGKSSGGYLDNHQARANVVNEIISAEREYVKHLRDVVEGYVKQTRKRPEMFPVEKVNIIFSNIENIYDFATELLAQLEESLCPDQPHLSQLGRCFLGSIKSFEMYSDYCNNHPAACEELRELYRNKRYRHFFEACRLLQEMIEIPLEGFLLTPVQKICKYHLQLAELLKFTPPSHPDHAGTRDALEAMKRIATLINERKRKMESVEKLAAWQLLVDDWEGPDILESSSELIYSGELNKVNHAGWSQERYFFLFDHQLIYCKKDLLKKSGFGYKGRIYMDACSVVSVPDGRDSQYNVSVRNAWKLHDSKRDKWYLLVAKTAVAKQRWLKAFQDERRRVKDDAEHNFNIPSHVKEAVVTSFKQKANLNKPKGRVKFNRTNSTQSFSTYSSDVNAYATLPRNKGRNKVKVKIDDDEGKSGGSGGKKITRFFLGKGKS